MVFKEQIHYITLMKVSTVMATWSAFLSPLPLAAMAGSAKKERNERNNLQYL